MCVFGEGGRRVRCCGFKLLRWKQRHAQTYTVLPQYNEPPYDEFHFMINALACTTSFLPVKVTYSLDMNFAVY